MHGYMLWQRSWWLQQDLCWEYRVLNGAWSCWPCAAVWTSEALNTAFEYLADATTTEFHPVIGQAKDVAAGAVPLTAIGASIVGVLVFAPYVQYFASTHR
jgi:diacylglycerol kinase